MLDESGLIKQVLNGRPNVFAVLVKKYSGPIFAYCLDRIRNRADAEDLAQEVFVIAYRRLATLRQTDSFVQWVYGIAANLVRNFLRTRKDPVSLDGNFPGPAADYDTHGYVGARRAVPLHIVREAVAELPEKYRVAVTLRFMESMSYREIAKAFGTTTGQVSSMLSRANRHLEAKLRKHFAPEPLE